MRSGTYDPQINVWGTMRMPVCCAFVYRQMTVSYSLLQGGARRSLFRIQGGMGWCAKRPPWTLPRLWAHLIYCLQMQKWQKKKEYQFNRAWRERKLRPLLQRVVSMVFTCFFSEISLFTPCVCRKVQTQSWTTVEVESIPWMGWTLTRPWASLTSRCWFFCK